VIVQGVAVPSIYCLADEVDAQTPGRL
jgi:hypothetical protein